LPEGDSQLPLVATGSPFRPLWQPPDHTQHATHGASKSSCQPKQFPSSVNLISGARTVSRTQDPPPPPAGLLLRRISSAAGFRSSDGCLRNWACFRNRSPVRKKPSPFNCPSDELQKHNRFRVLHANTPNLQKELMEASETCGSIKKRNWHKPET